MKCIRGLRLPPRSHLRDATQSRGRGPTGAYGGFAAESAERRGPHAIAPRPPLPPRTPPGKSVFTYLTNDMLARWEGGLGITGTPYDGSAIKVWGAKYGDSNNDNGGPVSTHAPPLHNWESTCNPTATPCATIRNNQTEGQYVPGAVGTYSAPWNQWYLHYALGRVAELGFAAEPLSLWSGQYPIGMINNSGLPILVTQYEMPVEQKGGGFFPTWPAVIKALTPGWVNGPCATSCSPSWRLACLFPQQFGG